MTPLSWVCVLAGCMLVLLRAWVESTDHIRSKLGPPSPHGIPALGVWTPTQFFVFFKSCCCWCFWFSIIIISTLFLSHSSLVVACSFSSMMFKYHQFDHFLRGKRWPLSMNYVDFSILEIYIWLIVHSIHLCRSDWDQATQVGKASDVLIIGCVICVKMWKVQDTQWNSQCLTLVDAEITKILKKNWC